MHLALTVTPHGIPVLGVLVGAAMLAVALWDARRFPGEPWFRWLLPLGLVVEYAAVATLWLPLVPVGAVLLGAGLGLTNYWRWTRRRT
ncbi:hypothetical protein [Kitasatospora sp. NPDC054795]